MIPSVVAYGVDVTNSTSSVINNCHFKVRDDEKHPWLIFVGADDRIKIHLDGYAIVPLEEYKALVKLREEENPF